MLRAGGGDAVVSSDAALPSCWELGLGRSPVVLVNYLLNALKEERFSLFSAECRVLAEGALSLRLLEGWASRSDDGYLRSSSSPLGFSSGLCVAFEKRFAFAKGDFTQGGARRPRRLLLQRFHCWGEASFLSVAAPSVKGPFFRVSFFAGDDPSSCWKSPGEALRNSCENGETTGVPRDACLSLRFSRRSACPPLRAVCRQLGEQAPP